MSQNLSSRDIEQFYLETYFSLQYAYKQQIVCWLSFHCTDTLFFFLIRRKFDYNKAIGL